MNVPSRKVTKIAEVEAHSTAVTCLALGQMNGRVLATGGADCLVNLWIVGQKTPLKSLAGLPSAAVCVKFDPTEESVVAGSTSGSLKVWDLAADKIKRTLTGHKSDVTAVDFLPLDPNFIVSGSTDLQVKIWDLRQKACVISFKQHQDSIKDVLFSPHGKWITSAGIDGTVQVYQWQAGKLLKEFVHSRSSPVYSLAFHPNDLLLASAGQDGVVKFWDLETFEAISQTDKETSAIRCIRFQRDGSSLLAGCDDILRNYGWEPSACFDVVPVGWGRVGDMAVSGRSNQLVTASVGKSTVVTYIVDLSRIRGKDTVVDEAEKIDSGPVYKTLPRKLKDPSKRVSQIPAKLPARSRSKEPNNRISLYNLKAKESAVDANEVFAPTRQLNRSPPRDPSPSSPSGSSPVRARRKSVSPGRKTVKPLFHSRNRKSGPNVQIIRPLPKGSEVGKDNGKINTRTSAPISRSQSDNFALPDTVKIGVPFTKPYFHIPDNNLPSVIDEPFGSSLPAHFRPPVMPVYPVSKHYPMDQEAQPYDTSDVFAMYETSNLNGAALNRIRISHAPLIVMLRNRLENLRSIQQMWSQGDVKAIVDGVIRFNDPAVLVDVLNIFCTKPSLWTLDCCSLVLPHLHKLISHKFESYILAAVAILKLSLKTFGPIIKTNLNAVPSFGVNISQEERVQKSRICYSHLLLLREFIEKDSRNHSQNLKKECRQIKLLMQGLE
ncbi:katanin p80 WD40 repeat-containing subunit B1-like [Paramacrobiotus metropolitanus]|uniref:katanin p80 WD40 repeat-containing subunit B1-like n=1 Tax=Paramacrobiotus metropolitanus TaxID=2943436 RepID=UPI0024465918|nr:katanin p80 WD40 repeat-containing subunit B1-like [Paramacrobiotus metropolitanus]XP_055338336.1 katanin p80 WD40 repeat-containing subunit B1-like [Paramacrobiotus metropolitanus]